MRTNPFQTFPFPLSLRTIHLDPYHQCMEQKESSHLLIYHHITEYHDLPAVLLCVTLTICITTVLKYNMLTSTLLKHFSTEYEDLRATCASYWFLFKCNIAKRFTTAIPNSQQIILVNKSQKPFPFILTLKRPWRSVECLLLVGRKYLQYNKVK